MGFVIKPTKPVTIDTQWIEYRDGAKLLVYGVDRPSFQEAWTRYHASKQAGGFESLLKIKDTDASNFSRASLIIGHYLVGDWMGFESPDGSALAYSPDLLLTLLESDPALMNLILKEAERIQYELNSEIEETVKKPSLDTSGSPPIKVRKKTEK